tara:strand:- start:207 stop:476 length:270 start_codon:yes stop_codon:yes gene_type:complete
VVAVVEINNHLFLVKPHNLVGQVVVKVDVHLQVQQELEMILLFHHLKVTTEEMVLMVHLTILVVVAVELLELVETVQEVLLEMVELVVQ